MLQKGHLTYKCCDNVRSMLSSRSLVNGDKLLTTLSAWGPTLVMLLAVAIAGSVAWRIGRPRKRIVFPDGAGVRPGGNLLVEALNFAELIYAYNPALRNDPAVHFGEVIRLAPAEYQDGAIEIPKHFKSGNVVSIDLGAMTNCQAARLVDFCGGLLAGTSGWLFRATDRVIVLTPSNR
jgi:Cell division protein SepF